MKPAIALLIQQQCTPSALPALFDTRKGTHGGMEGRVDSSFDILVAKPLRFLDQSNPKFEFQIPLARTFRVQCADRCHGPFSRVHFTAATARGIGWNRALHERVLGVVIQIRRKPAFDLGEVHAFAQMIINHLIAPEFPDRKVF